MGFLNDALLHTGHWTRSNPVYKISTFTGLAGSNVLITGWSGQRSFQ